MQKEQMEQKTSPLPEQEETDAAEQPSQDFSEEGAAGPAPDDEGGRRQRTPPKDSLQLKGWIEALLFAAGRYMTLAELKELCAVEEPGLIREAIKELREDLERRQSPLAITGEHDAWKLSVAQAYLPIVEGIMPEMELDKPLLETLAVIAWRQPILQSEIIKIRSTTAYDHIKELLDKNFITRERYGRSFVLKTTKQFEEYFELPGRQAAKRLFAGIEGELEASMKKKGRMGDLTVYSAQEPGEQEEKEELHVESYFVGKDEREGSSDDEQEEAIEGQEREEGDVEPADGIDQEEQEPDEKKAMRIIEELAHEDEPEEQDEQSASGNEDDKLHPAIERFADKVPLPKTEAKAGSGGTSDDGQDGQKEEKE